MGVRIATLTLAIAATAGCTSVGPLDAATVLPRLSHATGIDAQAIEAYGRCDWFRNTNGFENVRAGDGVKEGLTVLSGVGLVTADEFVFLRWDERASAYSVAYRARFSELNAVDLQTWGVNRRLVLQDMTYAYHSVSFSNDAGSYVSVAKTERAYELATRGAAK